MGIFDLFKKKNLNNSPRPNEKSKRIDRVYLKKLRNRLESMMPHIQKRLEKEQEKEWEGFIEQNIDDIGRSLTERGSWQGGIIYPYESLSKYYQDSDPLELMEQNKNYFMLFKNKKGIEKKSIEDKIERQNKALLRKWGILKRDDPKGCMELLNIKIEFLKLDIKESKGEGDFDFVLELKKKIKYLREEIKSLNQD